MKLQQSPEMEGSSDTQNPVGTLSLSTAMDHSALLLVTGHVPSTGPDGAPKRCSRQFRLGGRMCFCPKQCYLDYLLIVKGRGKKKRIGFPGKG